MFCFENQALDSCVGLCMLKCLHRLSVNLRGKVVVVLYNLQAILYFVVPVVGLTGVGT